ncbi:MAG: restriction endonuclease [Deltaproteobacteria bacterium]|nr:restriction endonuclease [Deltaproteobacteria bacterium]
MEDNVLCGNCEKPLVLATKDDQAELIPCPDCGSTSRNIPLEVEDTLHLSVTTFKAEVTLGSTNLLLQTSIIPGPKTSEGRLIEAVAIPWFEIIFRIKDDPSIAYQIPSERWEEIIAGACKRAGFDEVTLTPRSGDLGRDVIAVKKGIGHVRIIDQVKAYKPGHLVKANDVRALMGVLHGDGASKGFLTTTSDFAPRIKEDPLITPFIPARLEHLNILCNTTVQP